MGHGKLWSQMKVIKDFVIQFLNKIILGMGYKFVKLQSEKTNERYPSRFTGHFVTKGDGTVELQGAGLVKTLDS